MVQPRRSIHNRHSISPQRNESDQDESILDENHDQIYNKSDSELEEQNLNCTQEFISKEILEKSPSTPRTPKVCKINAQRAFLVYEPHATKSNKKFLWGIVSVILILIAYYSLGVQKDKTCSFKKLQEQYPAKKPFVWNHLQIGIELILNKQKQNPAVYLFTHQGDQHDFQLIQDIAKLSSACFGNKMLPVQMKSEDFMSAPGSGDDFGHTIQKYKNKIKQGNVMLIANLNQIPARAARALHFICDTYSPIVENVVILLTLTTAPNKIGSADAIAEETLIEMWGSNLSQNELDPLITRVTDQVIAL